MSKVAKYRIRKHYNLSNYKPIKVDKEGEQTENAEGSKRHYLIQLIIGEILLVWVPEEGSIVELESKVVLEDVAVNLLGFHHNAHPFFVKSEQILQNELYYTWREWSKNRSR